MAVRQTDTSQENRKLNPALAVVKTNTWELARCPGRVQSVHFLAFVRRCQNINLTQTLDLLL